MSSFQDKMDRREPQMRSIRVDHESFNSQNLIPKRSSTFDAVRRLLYSVGLGFTQKQWSHLNLKWLCYIKKNDLACKT